MRAFIILAALIAAVALGYFLPREVQKTASASVGHTYVCSMHPWITSEKPGKCTICGMDLVPSTSAAPTADPGIVTLMPASASVVGVQTSEVKRGSLVRAIRIAGVIDDDDTRHRILAARVPGRVEKLFVNFVGAEVTEGAPLATIYSPEMLTAQRLYVERLRAGATAFTVSERAAARERLLELGLMPNEVGILDHTLEPTAMVTVRAPMTGTVVSRAAYEGQYVQTNDRLFEIGDFSSMWFVFDAHESDLPWLRVGQSVEVTTPSRPGESLVAPIAFIDPNLNETTRTIRVRVVLANPDRKLLHKQTAFGEVRVSVPDLLLVPRSAILQHRGAPIVYVALGGLSYRARGVRLGRIGDDEAEVIDGLAAGERVVTQGGLVIDSQAQLAHASLPAAATAAMPMETPRNAAPATHDAGALDLLAKLALATADGTASLAADDLAAYQRQLPAIREALSSYLKGYAAAVSGPLGTFASKLADPADLKSARRDFEPFSTALADLVRETGINRREKLSVFQCPMSPVLGTGRWIQRNAELKNPFFGSAMLACGEEIN